MKIATLISGSAADSIHILDFFREGNRVEFDCALTDNPDCEGAQALRGKGVEIFSFPPAEWTLNPEKISQFLLNRGVQLVVTDDFRQPLPPEFGDPFQGGMLRMIRPESMPGTVKVVKDGSKQQVILSEESEQPDDMRFLWPRAIVDAISRSLDPDLPDAAATTPDHSPTPSDPSEEQMKDWANTLKVSYNPVPQPQPAPGATPPPLPGANPGFPSSPFGMQPNDGGRPRNNEPMPPTYLVWAVLATVLCCMPAGIVAIVYAASVSSKYYAGDIEGARRASRRAEAWIIASVVLGLVWATLYVPFMLLMPS